jgi:hypothetical protein
MVVAGFLASATPSHSQARIETKLATVAIDPTVDGSAMIDISTAKGRFDQFGLTASIEMTLLGFGVVTPAGTAQFDESPIELAPARVLLNSVQDGPAFINKVIVSWKGDAKAKRPATITLTSYQTATDHAATRHRSEEK